MQVLKTEIKDAILNSAKKEFLHHDYQRASMRTIAKNAEITVGNLYRYFENKELILETIIAPLQNHLQELLNHKPIDLCSLSEENIESIIKTEIMSVSSELIGYREEMIILLEKSYGTRFEATKDKYITYLEESIRRYFTEKSTIQKSDIVAATSQAFAVSVTEGLISIFKTDQDADIIKESLFLFLFVSLKNFIEFMKNS